MRKHRTVKIIGIAIIVAALVYLVLGVIGAISLGGSGLGEGWSSGWRCWLTIPILATTLMGFVALLVFGALLYFLAKIDNNLAEAQQRMAEAAAKPAAVVAPVAVAAGVAAAEQAEPAVEGAAPEVAAPAAEAATVEVAAPAIAATAAAVVVAADRHEEAVEVETATPEADVAAPGVEVEAAIVATAAMAGVVAAEQRDDAVAVEVVAPAVEVETPAVAAAVAVAAAELPEEAAEAEVAAPMIETPAVEVVTPEAEIAAPKVEPEAPVAALAAAAPEVDDTEALRTQIANLQAQLAALDSPAAPVTTAAEAPARLPGTEEAARIAAEMAALKPPKS